MTKKEKKLDSATAKEFLTKEEQARAARCTQKVQVALAEDNCEIVVGMMVTQRGNAPTVQIVARPK